MPAIKVWTGSGWQDLAIVGATGAPGLTPRGEWNAATAYNVNDVIIYSRAAPAGDPTLVTPHRRKVAGTTATAPDVDTTNWEQLVSRGPRGFTGLTGDVGPSAIPPIVTALPGSPVNGQECYFQNTAMHVAGVGPWHLRYRTLNPDGSGNGNTHKWDVVGGNPWRVFITADTSALESAGIWRDATTPAPLITPPLAGVYLAQAGCDMYSNAITQHLSMGITVGATTPSPQHDSYVAAASQRQAISIETELTITLGQDIRMRYRGDAVGGQYFYAGRRGLIVTPLRVG